MSAGLFDAQQSHNNLNDKQEPDVVCDAPNSEGPYDNRRYLSGGLNSLSNY